MAYLDTEIDMSGIDPSKPRETIPPGWQKAMIDNSEVKPTKDAAKAIEYNETGNPKFNDRLIVLAYKIIEGPHEGRTVFSNYNIINSNPTAQEIARKDIAAIREAIGIPKDRPFRDSDELHGRPLQILIDVEKKPDQNPRNIIKGYRPIGEAIERPVGAASVGASPRPAAAPAAKPAWAGK